MTEVPEWLRAPPPEGQLIITPDGEKPKAAPRPTFDFKPVVYAPAIRRPGFLDPVWLIGGTPRPVQIEALRRGINGYALFDGKDGVERFRQLRVTGFGPDIGFNYYMEMRLGKTYVSLNDFATQRFNNVARWLVAVVPNFLKQQWIDEYMSAAQEQLGLPTMQWQSGKKDDVRGFIIKNPTGGLLVINYEAFNSKETEKILSPLSGITMWAFDESIKLKNPDGVQYKALHRLTARAPRVVNLSGKPLTQGPHDLFGQLQMAHMEKGWRYPSFKTHFTEKGGHKGMQIVGARNVEELQTLYLPRSFVARFNDWYDGEGVEQMEPRYVELHPKQQAMIKDLEADMMTAIGDTAITASQIISRNMKMQQVRSGFIFDNESVPHTVVEWRENPLFQELLRILREEINRKVIIVGYYQPTMDMLTEALAEFNPAVIRSAEWHKKSERPIEAEKLRYNTDSETRVLLAQESSLSYGHTLMGTRDDPTGYLIFFEQNYSLNDRSQSEKRPQGVGQVFKVGVLDFFASKLDRERVLSLQRKEDMASVVLNFARSEGVLPYAV